MVITMVISTTRVAPKLRANSLRIEDWNNIDWVNALTLLYFLFVDFSTRL